MRKLALLLSALLGLLLLCACSGGNTNAAGQVATTGRLRLDYATQFEVEYRADGTSLLTIGGTDVYELVPEGTSANGDATAVTTPVADVYLAASSAMDFFRQLDALGSVSLTSTKAKDWSLDEVVTALDEGSMVYAGSYGKPDYERILAQEAKLAIESTMIYHAPEVKERLEDLGIPVLTERSSYETSPLARLEWIKLYGLLTGRLDEAQEFFDAQVALLEATASKDVATDDEPTVAFFSIASSGHVVVRKPGDYVSQMIELAGGRYFLGSDAASDNNALSTMNMEMEGFYEAARDADVLIYNSAIDARLEDVDDLVAKNPRLADFKAVQSGDVWCTGKDLFQQPTCAAQMVAEMHDAFVGTEEGESEHAHLYHVGKGTQT